MACIRKMSINHAHTMLFGLLKYGDVLLLQWERVWQAGAKTMYGIGYLLKCNARREYTTQMPKPCPRRLIIDGTRLSFAGPMRDTCIKYQERSVAPKTIAPLNMRSFFRLIIPSRLWTWN